MPMHKPYRVPPSRQQGLILFTALIMIVLLSLVVVSSLSMSVSSVGVIKNLDDSSGAKAAAQSAIEQVISSPAFVSDPTSVAAAPVAVDVNSDGAADYNVALTAQCVSIRPVLLSELNTSLPAEAVCVQSGAENNSGIRPAAGVATSTSLCSDTRWNIRGIATKARTGARAEINQGVAVRMPIDEAQTYCG